MTPEERERSYEHYKQWQINKVRYRNECVAYVLLIGFGLFFVIEHWKGVFAVLGIALIVTILFRFACVIWKWNKKNEALMYIKQTAEEMGAREIEVDNKTGEISFVIDKGSADKRLEDVQSHLAGKGMKMKVFRETSESEDKTNDDMPVSKSELASTSAGYVNKNNQRNNGKTDKPGTDNNQMFYEMQCLNCGKKYLANGSDIWQRKCPSCQGGRP